MQRSKQLIHSAHEFTFMEGPEHCWLDLHSRISESSLTESLWAMCQVTIEFPWSRSPGSECSKLEV